MSIRVNDGLRRALFKITENFATDEHAALVAGLKRIYDHSIKVLKEPFSNAHGYNCFMYALGIAALPADVLQVARADNLFPDSSFLAFLIATRMEEIDKSLAPNGTVVVYFEPPNPKHAGLMKNGHVVSKWGIGLLWRHGLFEVPSSYGLNVRYFRPLSREVVLDVFYRYGEKLLGKRVAEDPALDTSNNLLPPGVRKPYSC